MKIVGQKVNICTSSGQEALQLHLSTVCEGSLTCEDTSLVFFNAPNETKN